MPRLSRELCELGMFHVMARCVPGLGIFERECDKQRFLAEIACSIRKYVVELYAYCVMSNHFHLLLCTNTVKIGTVMQTPLARIAQRWNWEYGRKGPVYDDRFKSIAITSERYFLNVARYIEYNPVKAGIVQRPEDYPWSSARAYLADEGDSLTSTERLLGNLSIGDDPMEYAAWLRSPEPAAWPHSGEPEWSGSRQTEPAPRPISEGLFTLAGGTAARCGMTMSELLSKAKRPVLVRARRQLISEAASVGHSGAEIARLLGCDKSLVSRVLSRRDKVNFGDCPES